jgi:hypothetical protein
MKCKTPTCQATTTKFLRCAACREMRNRIKRYLEKNAGKPHIIRYLKRKTVIGRVSTRNWRARNRKPRAASQRLRYRVRTGKVVRPLRCQDCRKKRQIVAWDLDAKTLRVGAWLCWSCVWTRKNAESSKKRATGSR